MDHMNVKKPEKTFPIPVEILSIYFSSFAGLSLFLSNLFFLIRNDLMSPLTGLLSQEWRDGKISAFSVCVELMALNPEARAENLATHFTVKNRWISFGPNFLFAIHRMKPTMEKKNTMGAWKFRKLLWLFMDSLYVGKRTKVSQILQSYFPLPTIHLFLEANVLSNNSISNKLLATLAG